ncbi:hypothetical protein [Shewanella sp.]|uniref:hypothetical protein n=1 Tax=Shewanella sp. TaxID=50422 RepID=UPI003A9832DB
MMRAWGFALSLLLSGSLSAQPFCQASNNEDGVYRALQQIRHMPQSVDATADHSSQYAEVFEQCQLAQLVTELTQIDNVALHKLFLDLNTISFFTLDERHIAAMLLVLREQQRRGLYVAHLAQNLYERYLVARALPQAQAIRQEFKLMPLPEYAVAAYQGRGLLRLSADQLVLSGDTAEHRMIIIAAPKCHFSQNFLAWADEQPQLKRWLASNALFLLPPSMSNDLESVRQMQWQYPWLPLAIAYKSNEWPQIKRWGTPSFYFHIAEQWRGFSGWPAGGNATQFMALQQKLLAHGDTN